MKILKYILPLAVFGLFAVSCQEETASTDNPYTSAINLTAEQGDLEVTLTWEIPAGAEPTDFFVYYDNASGMTVTNSTGGETTYTVTDLEDNFAYTFYVQALYRHLMSDPISTTVAFGNPDLDRRMILEYNVSVNTAVYLPLAGTVSCTVDWGDGSDTETVTSTFPSHTYVDAGVYDVTISGTVTRLSSNNSNIAQLATHDTKLIAVKQWGMTGLTDMSYAFRCCDNLASYPTDEYGAFRNVTTFEYAFGYQDSATKIPEGLFDYCSSATVFSGVFRQCEQLTEIPEGLFDCCTEAENFQNAFYGCTGLTSVPAGLFDNCKQVTNFSNAFYHCTNLTGESPYTVIDNVKVHLYDRTEDLGFVLPTTTSGCFSGDTGLTDYDDIPSSWR